MTVPFRDLASVLLAIVPALAGPLPAIAQQSIPITYVSTSCDVGVFQVDGGFGLRSQRISAEHTFAIAQGTTSVQVWVQLFSREYHYWTAQGTLNPYNDSVDFAIETSAGVFHSRATNVTAWHNYYAYGTTLPAAGFQIYSATVPFAALTANGPSWLRVRAGVTNVGDADRGSGVHFRVEP